MSRIPLSLGIAALMGAIVAAPSRADDGVDFSRDVAPIVAEHCACCHQPEGIAPFPLISADDVKKRAKQIAAVTQSRFMPPWLPADDDAELQFHGRRRLNQDQIATIGRWVDAGAPMSVDGGGAAVSENSSIRPAEPLVKWPLGAPDVILTLPEAYTIPAEGDDVMRTFVFPVRLDEDQFIKAIDFNAGNPRVVHHVAFLIDDTGSASRLDEADPGLGYRSMADLGFNLAGSRGVWSPVPRKRAEAFLPEGIAWPLPNRSEVVAEVHFNLTGKPETIQPRIGLYLTKEPVQRFPIPIALGASIIDIPADEKNYVVRDSFTMPADGKLLSIAPRAHYVCKRINITAQAPGQADQPIQLLRIEDWDFNWQQQFTFHSPVCLSEGTRIDVELVYDNSAENPRNPSHPPQRVRDGWKPTDEMGVVFLYVVPEERSGHELIEAARHDKLLKRFEEAKARRQLN
jgi:hypothetical protein